MKILSILTMFAAALFLTYRSAEAKDIIFAPLPMEQQIQVSRNVRPMLLYLEQQLNTTISINYFKDYDDIINKFSNDLIDLVFLGPLPYIQLHNKRSDAIPLVRFVDAVGNDTYTCSIISRMESEIESITVLKDKRIALTQPSSTCGYLMTNQLLRQAGLSMEDSQYRYSGNHQQVALSVLRGEADAGGIKTSIGHEYEHLALRFLAETKPLPGFVLVANGKTLATRQIETIRKALLQLQPLSNPSHRKLTSSWGKKIRYGAVTVFDEDYDGIRRELDQTSIPAQGNY